MQAKKALVLGLIALAPLRLFAQTKDPDAVFVWRADNAYSDRFLYNGYSYETIQIFNTSDPGFHVFIAAALARDNECPGTWRRCATNLIIASNEGTIPFDLNPDDFELLCSGGKPKALKHHVFPKFVRGAAEATGVVLLANTIRPGDRKSGAVIFDGSCAEYTLRLPIEARGHKIVFQFPFETPHR